MPFFLCFNLYKTLVLLFAFYNIKIVAKKCLLLYNINKLTKLKINTSREVTTLTNFTNLPVIAMRGNFFFPNVRAKIEVARTISVNAIKFAIENGGRFFMVSQLDPASSNPKGAQDLYTMGVIGEIVSVDNVNDQSMTVSTRTIERAKITRFSASESLFLADVETVDYICNNDASSNALYKQTIEYVKRLAKAEPRLKIDIKPMTAEHIDYLSFTNVVANEVVTMLPSRQDILEESNIDVRMEKICAYTVGQIEFIQAEKRIANRVKKQVEAGQKEYYLREQMRAISAELGEDANEKQEYLDKIKKSGMPEEVAKKTTRELNRLSKMSPTSPDAAVIRNYIDWLCEVPWATESEDNKDLVRARQILDEDHYGLEKIKDRIVEFLAVMQLTGKLNGPILCFVGPPGVGKTSIVRSIARALDRKYLRVSLGGVRDEAEIRGHRRTYVGAIPGKIIYMMKQAECINPVLLLDEIDKMGKDNREVGS